MIESAEEFVRLRTSEDPALYGRAALEAAPEEVWLQVIEEYPNMRKWVVQNKAVPHSILSVLAEDDDPDVRWWVAMKRMAGPTLLEKLAADCDESVRHRVALNPKTPLCVLQKLVHDECEDVALAARQRIQNGDYQ